MDSCFPVVNFIPSSGRVYSVPKKVNYTFFPKTFTLFLENRFFFGRKSRSLALKGASNHFS